MRRRDPYRVGPDLTWVGAVLAAVVIAGFVGWLVTQLIDVS
jgi:hypothetical protein